MVVALEFGEGVGGILELAEQFIHLHAVELAEHGGVDGLEFFEQLAVGLEAAGAQGIEGLLELLLAGLAGGGGERRGSGAEAGGAFGALPELAFEIGHGLAVGLAELVGCLEAGVAEPLGGFAGAELLDGLAGFLERALVGELPVFQLPEFLLGLLPCRWLVGGDRNGGGRDGQEESGGEETKGGERRDKRVRPVPAGDTGLGCGGGRPRPGSIAGGGQGIMQAETGLQPHQGVAGGGEVPARR